MSKKRDAEFALLFKTVAGLCERVAILEASLERLKAKELDRSTKTIDPEALNLSSLSALGANLGVVFAGRFERPFDLDDFIRPIERALARRISQNQNKRFGQLMKRRPKQN
ncbi:hypothetical protein [Roseibium suaedae]|uniref:Uncharacterized protein n=1 Tax=Roseibium suaedae TaxID=735517 RepID=A0A1M7PMQ5_9HYPH|nr:hypothetical protein [Roseibium suaedae]SHN18540.1 hypothetical protein SAMN05444272_4523 [Roseibium suaedae]